MKKFTTRRQLPPTQPSAPEQATAWWEQWVDFVRNSPWTKTPSPLDPSKELYYGHHLFLGWETHNHLFRTSRAVGVSDKMFQDGLQYQDVRDLRAWALTNPATLLLHEGILAEHCYIVGPSGAGKTSLGIMPMLMQLIRGGKTNADSLPEPYPIIILDLKGDNALFHTVKKEAAERKQPFKFFTTEKDAPTFRFNPFRGFDRDSRTIAQLCQLILDSLSLNHGKGYGRSYYTERSRNVLSRTLREYPNIFSFIDLHEAVERVVQQTPDSRTRSDAFELLSVIEMLKEYDQLVTGPDEDVSSTEDVIFMPNVLKNREVAYFWLPAALESISIGEIAKLVLFNLRTAAQDWKRQHPDPKDARRVILVIDELQRVAGENLQGILQDARSFGISAILANQSLEDLRSPTGFDLGPTIMTNTRVKFFFTSPSEQECYLYVERGKELTEARPYPALHNPWLKDLSPEEFGYHVRLAWPLDHDEYKRRDAANLPSWEDIPGSGAWHIDLKKKRAKRPTPTAAAIPSAGILSSSFTPLQDDTWRQQVAAIRALFPNREISLDEAIGPLFDS